MDSALDQIAEKCGNQLKAYRTYPYSQKSYQGLIIRKLCIDESIGLGEEM